MAAQVKIKLAGMADSCVNNSTWGKKSTRNFNHVLKQALTPQNNHA